MSNDGLGGDGLSNDGLSNDGELGEEEANALLDRLGVAIADTEAVPPWLTQFANESHRLISFESELAEIVSDSFVDDSVGMRSGAGARLIEFAVDVGDQRVTVSLQVDGLSVRGSVTPAQASIVVVTESDRISLDTNERGFFSFTAPEGLFRFEIGGAGTTVRTDWINLS